MIQIKNTEVFNIVRSLKSSGLPYRLNEPETLEQATTYDFERAKKLGRAKPGSGHDNFLKGIIVQFDLYYPQYFTPQLQRYKFIDIVSSQSKMHKLTSIADISGHCSPFVSNIIISVVNDMIAYYNREIPIYPVTLHGINIYNKTELFSAILANLPSGFMLWMAISTNYLQLKTIYNQRKDHKLPEWQYFCDWIVKLPHFKQLAIK